jgi:hypothetical protein
VRTAAVERMVEDALEFFLLYGLAHKAAIIGRWRNVWWTSACFFSALIDGPNMLVVVVRALLLVLLLVLLVLVMVLVLIWQRAGKSRCRTGLSLRLGAMRKRAHTPLAPLLPPLPLPPCSRSSGASPPRTASPLWRTRVRPPICRRCRDCASWHHR